MRVKLEPETAFIGKKFAYIFLGLIFGLNSIVFVWYFFFSNLTWNWSLTNKSYIILIGISFELKLKLRLNSDLTKNQIVLFKGCKAEKIMTHKFFFILKVKT